VGCDGLSLTQPGSMVKKTGRTVEMTCTLAGASMQNVYVHWYHGNPGKEFQWILYYRSESQMKTSPAFSERFSAVKSGQLCILTIIKPVQEDTATYYCGLWHSHRPPRHTRHRTKSCLSQDHLGCSWDCVLKGRLLTAAEKTI
uniref:Ig-like domain-containing protein n=1 Tax=Callorhinchus milii TaxID=7868 RepID=A0A4W3HB06_CALMI